MAGRRYEDRYVSDSARVREAVWRREGSDGRVSLESKGTREILKEDADLELTVASVQ